MKTIFLFDHQSENLKDNVAGLLKAVVDTNRFEREMLAQEQETSVQEAVDWHGIENVFSAFRDQQSEGQSAALPFMTQWKRHHQEEESVFSDSPFNLQAASILEVVAAPGFEPHQLEKREGIQGGAP
ncbi:MAG: hypothetical protein AAF483_24505 [Planctomycetota bacterium]